MPETLLEGIHRVDLGNVNAYLVETDEGPVIVDAGMPGKAAQIREAMRELGLDPSALRRVLVTHTDLDHVGGLAGLVEGTGATIHLTRTASELLTGERRPPWLNTKGLFQRMTSPFLTPPPRKRFRLVQDGDRVEGFLAVETPGHALGHVAFVQLDRGVCFVGDLVRTQDGAPRLPPRVINYDTGRIRESIRHLLDVAPAFDVLCAGHGDPVLTDADEALARLIEPG